MRGCADLRGRQIERDLDRNDQSHVCQSLFRMRRVPVPQQKSGPRADDSHNRPRCADQLSRLYQTYYSQSHHAGAGGEP